MEAKSVKFRMVGWRQINTAPRDTHILIHAVGSKLGVYEPVDNLIEVMEPTAIFEGFCWTDHERESGFDWAVIDPFEPMRMFKKSAWEPTHWHPKLKAPTHGR